MKLTIDIEKGFGPVNPLWAFGGNTCHAALLLRRDLQSHLEIIQRELGFQYIRCHGWLNDDMGVMQADGSYSFGRVEAACAALLEIGVKPFIEFSGMPGALASNDKTICFYKMRTSPPSDWAKWEQLIEAMVKHLTEAFGEDEVKQWYFEVWNEPDIAFWSGTQAEYFRLYDHAAAAVKRVCPAYRIGGPATARTAWIDEFLEHLGKPSQVFDMPDASRCDVITTHAYPSDVAFVDSARGDVQLQSANLMRQLFGDVRRKVDAALGPDFPVICGEWNSSAGPFAENHDTCNNAAFIAKTMIELSDSCQGSLVWNCSDIYEEVGFHSEPFHGGYGLLTVNDIRKAAFHAFALLGQHTGQRVQVTSDTTTEAVGALATIDDEQWRLLIYNHVDADAEPTSCEIVVDGLPMSEADVTVVAPGAGSAYETYQQLGRPQFANRQVLELLEDAAQPRRQRMELDAAPLRIEPGTVMQLVGSR